VIPALAQTTSLLPTDAFILSGGVRAVDAILLAMAAAAGLRLVRLVAGSARSRLPVALLVASAAFAAYLAMEAARNLPAYGLSTYGELRFSHLVLVVIPYLALLADTPLRRRRLARIVIAWSIIAPLLFAPIVAYDHQWAIGPSSRFFPAIVSLGMVYALVAWYLSERDPDLRASLPLLAVATLGVLALVIVDSHRSVWLAAAVLALVLVFLSGRLKAGLIRWLVYSVLVVLLLLVAGTVAGASPLQYIASRGSAFLWPSGDLTAAWRIALWRAYLPVIKADWLFGQGFGAYWSAGTDRGFITTSPHSLYVLTLVKTGVVGLLLYLAAATALLIALGGHLRRVRWSRRTTDDVLVLMGAVVFVSSSLYYLAYGLDLYSPVWVGLGVAALASARRTA
jgi:O-antigen ligase